MKLFGSPVLLVTLLVALTGTAQSYYVASGQVYAESGAPVAVRGVSWFGFETETNSPHGLWVRNLDSMVTQMREVGFNAVRVPISPPVLRGDPVAGIDFSSNPTLQGLDSLQLLDHLVTTLDAAGMYILLDHHRPDNNAISPLWYTNTYSERQWLDDLAFMAERYKGVYHFLGIELKNEPHGTASWGANNPATDWNRAAERASARVLSANSDLLVFVAGIQRDDHCSKGPNHWWGGNLEPIRCAPLDIPADKLVLAPHFYGPDVFMQPYFQVSSFPGNMPGIWDTHFGFARDYGYTLVPTEYGSRYGHGGSTLERVWFDALIDYLVAREIRDGFYWSWNPNSGDTGGILQDDWQSVWPDKVAKLQELWGDVDSEPMPPPVPPTPNPTPTSTPPPVSPLDPEDPAPPVNEPTTEPSPPADEPPAPEDDASSPPVMPPSVPPEQADIAGALQVTTRINNDWISGYCATVEVMSQSDSAIEWQIQLPFTDTITSAWNGEVSVRDNVLTARGPGWQPILAAHSKTNFSFCAERNRAPDSDEDNLGPQSAELAASVRISSDWQAGYCADVRVENTTSAPVIWQATFPIEGIVANSWNVELSTSNGTVRASGVDWNAELASGATAHFGFCASR